MKKAYSSSLLVAALLVCGACSNVRQAPVEDRGETAAAPGPPAVSATEPVPVTDPAPVTEPAAGVPAPERDDAQWEELPGSAEPAPTAAAARTAQMSDNPAVIALLDDTELSISRGNPEAAAGAVERALRLEPKNPWLWHRLAVLKLGQGDLRLAVALAQKSNSLAAGHPELRRANADLIERASRQAGPE